MPGNFKKDDLRIKKTYNALISATMKLLNERKFSSITVNEICGEALISRATFYAHFDDKYDLLRYLTEILKADMRCCVGDYKKLETLLNSFFMKHSRLITNLLDYADSEVLEIVLQFISGSLKEYMTAKTGNRLPKNSEILLDYCSGGLYRLIVWQIKNKFPPDKPFVNEYVHDMHCSLVTWAVQQEQE